MTADTQNDWYRVLSLARSNAAQDLRISNEILEVSDSLIAAAKAGDLSEEQITEISKDLIKRALELSDNSKEINFAITKLVGAL
ncbi:MAG: hypothetical protein CBB87_05770 [Micavibrio sp. TMED27]|nr:hypothetical protein [Micavibrio sp.]OUT91525.1 MAG: hypothetical protein CBB87_05770 [Micavibrio sp. TMED27]|tara:strand:- start:1054 stop:1305 length:252 start_codon:yes stop_codon:yes gene_type:complete